MVTPLPIVILLHLVSISTALPQDRQAQRKWLMGQTPPELTFQKEHWLGKTPGTTLADLKGKAVWLQFNF